MTDIRTMYDKEFIYAYDLGGKDITVRIERIKAGELTGTDGKKTKKPVLYFKGTKKGLGLNITNARIIAGLYGGFDSEAWIGKRITLYATTCDAFGKVADCIRVRPRKPADSVKEQSISDDVPVPTEPTGTPDDHPEEATA